MLSIVLFFLQPLQLILLPDPDYESSLTLSRGQPGKNKSDHRYPVKPILHLQILEKLDNRGVWLPVAIQNRRNI